MKKIKNYIKNNYKNLIFDLLYVSFLFAMVYIKLPLVVYSPGDLSNISERIKTNQINSDQGSYNMLSVKSRIPNIPTVLFGYIFPNWDVVKESEVTLENETITEMKLRDKLFMNEAIANAKIVALEESKTPYEVTNVINRVIYLTKDNKTGLKINDEILLLDGYKVTNIDSIKEYIQTKKIGDQVSFYIKRDNKKMSIPATIMEEEGVKKIGLMLITTYDIKTNSGLIIETKNNESGPSGGLMTALAIYDSLIKEDLTKGRKIAGTGTIDKDGNIGEIGGIKYKLIAANNNKVDLLLVPKDNYEEAVKVIKEKKLKLKIYGVETFKEAIDILKNSWYTWYS